MVAQFKMATKTKFACQNNKSSFFKKKKVQGCFVLCPQGRTGYCGNAAIAARLFVENARLFFKECVIF
jgi:hypothetical protein